MKNLNKYVFGTLILVTIIASLLPKNSLATVYTINLALTGQQEVPPNPSTATGILMGTYDDATKVLSFTMMFNGLSSAATAAHFHGPAAPGANAPVVIPLTGFPAASFGSYTNSFTLTVMQESQLLCGLWYVNIHTSGYPAGEIRSQVKEGTTTGNITNYAVAISGLNVMPPNLSPATGSFIGTFDNTTNVLSFTIMFNGLTAPVSAAHIHGPAAAGTNGPVLIMFPAFPTGVTSGVYTNSFILTSTQKNYLLAGLLYVNIHNSQYPGGEMRGQLVEGTLTGGNCAASIPTLSQWGLIILCLLLLGTGMVYIVRRQNSYVS